jgi:hypothetical protein
MGPGEYLILLLFFPVVMQIIVPLMVLCGWMVIKLPLSLLGWDEPTTLAEEAALAR